MKKILENKNSIIIIFLATLLVTSCLTFFVIKKYSKEDESFIINKVIYKSGLSLKKTNYYVANNDEIILEIDNPNNSEYKINIEDKNIVAIEGNKLMAINEGKTNFSIEIEGFNFFEGTIYVVKGLVKPGNGFDKSKKFVSCNEYTDEENELLDRVLRERINTVGDKTRAGVVAAARFLTLEFANRIAYFYENGRLNNYGESKKVDGEGRYYHKGLYLSKAKYQDISYKFTGPGAWGCKITQYEDAPQYGFIPRNKYPNGFDCSGFISWVLYNGGFDVKDSGAGDIGYRNDDLYDLGEKRILNSSLLSSGEVKVGDLIAYPGHMAIIAGIDDGGNYYVAESLPQFKGVVLNKYNQTKLKATFTHIMLMDSVYLKDGNLTNMWY